MPVPYVEYAERRLRLAQRIAAQRLPPPWQWWLQELITHLQDIAWHEGVAFERRRAAEAWTDVEAGRERSPVVHRSHEQQVADRIAAMRESAQRYRREYGLPEREYTGGPVDWETGEPIDRKEAA
ncbi:MAG: hypothetical protein ACRD0P_05450 [Stackebrandtia sp.]